MIEASVIIPNWNGRAYIEGCLDSLAAQTVSNFEVIVIDNGSEDGSDLLVEERYPKVRLRRFKENTGFCRAINEGIRLSKAPYVIFLNNDILCDPAFVEELLKAIKARPKAFSCQAMMCCMDDPQKLDDGGDLYCALGWAFARGKGKQANRYTKDAQIFASCGGAAIYRKSVLNKIGLLDERHFAYLEDVDLGYRANLHGFRSYYTPAAKVLHAGSASSGSAYNLFKVTHTSRNSIYLIYKNMPLWQILLNLPFLSVGFLIKTVFFVRKGLGGAYVKGLLRGVKMADPEKKVSFSDVSGKDLWWVQRQLWLNMLRRL